MNLKGQCGSLSAGTPCKGSATSIAPKYTTCNTPINICAKDSSIVLKNLSTFPGGQIDSIAFCSIYTIPGSIGFKGNDTSCVQFKHFMNSDSDACLILTNEPFAILNGYLKLYQLCSMQQTLISKWPFEFNVFFNPRPEFYLLTKDTLCIDAQPFKFKLKHFCEKLLDTNYLKTKYLWDFGDPNITIDTSTLPNPTYSYNQPGTYWVKCTASNTCGIKTDSMLVVVSEISSVKNVPDSVCLKDSIQPIINAVNASLYETTVYNSSGILVTGAVRNASTNTPRIKFPSAGTYTIKFKTKGCCPPREICGVDTTIVVIDTPKMTLSPISNACLLTGTTYSLNFNTYFKTTNTQQTNNFYVFNSVGSLLYQYHGTGIPSPYSITLPDTYTVIDSSWNQCDTTVISTFFELSPETKITKIIDVPDSICVNKSFSPAITASNATSYDTKVYNSSGQPESNTVTNSTTANPIITITTSGKFTIKFKVAGCCGNFCEIDSPIVVIPGSSMKLDSIKDSCVLNFPYLLEFKKHLKTTDTNQINKFYVYKIGSGYKYNHSDTGVPPPLSIDSIGIYIVTDSSFNQCDTLILSDTFELTEPIVFAVPNDTTICVQTSLTLNAPTGVDIFLNNIKISLGTFYFPNPGTYTFEYRPTCGNTKKYIVTVLGTESYAKDIVTCDSLKFIILEATKTPSLFSGNYVSGNIFDISASGFGSFIFYSFYVDNSGCVFKDDGIIVVNQQITPTDTAPDTVCVGVQFRIQNLTPNSIATIIFDNNPPRIGDILDTTLTIGGWHYFTLSLFDNNGPLCAHYIYDSIFVITTTIPSFTLKDTVCSGTNVTPVVNGSPNAWTTYSWKIGNNQHPGFLPPTIVCNTTKLGDIDFIPVEFEAKTICGSVILYDTIWIITKPVAIFSPLIQDKCSPDTVRFTNNSAGFDIKYNWYINGTLFSTDSIPNFLVLTSNGYRDSTYFIKLVVSNGCSSDSLTKSFTIKASNFVACFTSNPTKSCLGTPIIFDDCLGSTFTTGNVSYFFGDGSSVGVKPGATVSHTYASSGVFAVKIIITNDCHIDSTIDSITIRPLPVFKPIVPDTGCRNDLIPFDAQQVSGNTIGNWFWEFGDGLTANQKALNHQYQNTGTAFWKLTVTDIFGCTHARNGVLTIEPMPNVTLNRGNTTICVKSLLKTNVDAFLPGTEYKWRLKQHYGFDTTITTYDGAITFDFMDSGEYELFLIAQNSNKTCTDSSKTILITVRQLPKIDKSNIPLKACNSDTVLFDAMITSVNTIATWNWDFGDGSTGNVPKPKHRYIKPGTYDWKLIMTDFFGCFSKDSGTMVINSTPSVKLNQGNQGIIKVCADSMLFISVDTFLTGASYNWTIRAPNGAITTIATYDGTLNFQFKDSGIFKLTLIAENFTKSCQNYSDTTFIFVRPLPQVATGSIPKELCARDTILFNASQTSYYPISDWFWEFGDGTISTAITEQHKYSSPGLFNWKLTVTDFFKCSSTNKGTLSIKPNPSVQLNIDSISFCSGKLITMSVDTPLTGIIYNWYLKYPGNKDTLLKTINGKLDYVYTDSGIYKLYLIAANADSSCKNVSKTVPIEVWPLPNVDIRKIYATACFPDSVYFYAPQIVGNTITQWLWQFGDGNSSPKPNVRYQFKNIGVYNWKLSVIDYLNCASEFLGSIAIDTVPDVTLNKVNDTLCLGSSSALSVNSFLTGVKYYWSVTKVNGTAITLTTTDGKLDYQFPDSGTYYISLKAENSNNRCPQFSDTVSFTVNPTIQIEVDSISKVSPRCTNDSINFNAKQVSGSPVISWLWELGDGETANTNTIKHKYDTAGTYLWKVTATDENRCIANLSGNITIYKSPYVTLNQTDTTLCVNPSTPPNLTFKVNSLVSQKIKYLWNRVRPNGMIDSFDESEFICSFEDSGLHRVFLIATEASGTCTSYSDTIKIRSILYPTAKIWNNAPEEIIDQKRFRINFYDSSSYTNSKTLYKWDLDNGFINYSRNPVQEYAFPIVFPITLKIHLTVSNEQCRHDTTKEIKVCAFNDYFYIPNAFTPNNDGLNDIFIPYFDKQNGYEYIKMEIFNLWGQRIYCEDTNGDIFVGWDGLVQRNRLITDGESWIGAYLYVISYRVCLQNGMETVRPIKSNSGVINYLERFKK